MTELHGDQVLRSVTLTNNKTGEKQNLPIKGLFVCIGGCSAYGLGDAGGDSS